MSVGVIGYRLRPATSDDIPAILTMAADLGGGGVPNA
jgi:hypothetical protein